MNVRYGSKAVIELWSILAKTNILIYKHPECLLTTRSGHSGYASIIKTAYLRLMAQISLTYNNGKFDLLKMKLKQSEERYISYYIILGLSLLFASCSPDVEWTDKTFNSCIESMTQYNKNRITSELNDEKLKAIIEITEFTCNKWNNVCTEQPNSHDCNEAKREVVRIENELKQNK